MDEIFACFLVIVSCNYSKVTDRQFLASEAWSTSSDLLQEPVTRKVASGVLGVAIRSSFLPGFASYIRNLNPSLRPDDKLLKEIWEKQFLCSTGVTTLSASLPPCNGSESLSQVRNLFTDTSQLRVTYNVYLAVYAAAHALHTLFSCPDIDTPPGHNSTCLLPNQISPREVNTNMSTLPFSGLHLNMGI